MPGTMNFHAEIGCFCGSINATELTCCMVIFQRVYKPFLARFSNALCQLLHVRKRTTSFFVWCGKSSTAAWENYKRALFPSHAFSFLFFIRPDLAASEGGHDLAHPHFLIFLLDPIRSYGMSTVVCLLVSPEVSLTPFRWVACGVNRFKK